jgi:hypothetical protein
MPVFFPWVSGRSTTSSPRTVLKKRQRFFQIAHRDRQVVDPLGPSGQGGNDIRIDFERG